MMRARWLGMVVVVVGCSGASAGPIPGSATQETNATDPADAATATTSDPIAPPAPQLETDDAGAPVVDGGTATDASPPSIADASSGAPDAAPPVAAGCVATVPAAVAFGQCAAKPAATLMGDELAEPAFLPRLITKGVPVCGSLKKGGKDTFTLPVNKGDCLAFDIHARSATLHVSGVSGTNISSAGGDDHALAMAGTAGLVTITVTAREEDDYTLTVR